MMIDTFSQFVFEADLPVNRDTKKRMWEYLGPEMGEHCYAIPLPTGLIIKIRSSISTSGYNISAPAGEDSIRVWIENTQEKSVGVKMPYISRVNGWRERLTTTLRVLWVAGSKYHNCPSCHGPMMLFRVAKKSANEGRLFLSCLGCAKRNKNRRGPWFEWVTGSNVPTPKPAVDEFDFRRKKNRKKA